MHLPLNEIITTLQQISGTNAKLDFLRQNAKNELLQAYINATYEPRINYFLLPKFLDKANIDPLLGDGSMDQDLIRLLRDTLAGRKLTGNAARNWVINIYQNLKAAERPLLYMLLAGDLRAKVSTTGFNKVWPNLISETPYMRCGLPRDADLQKWLDEDDYFYGQIKADGTFTNFEASETGFSVYSRSGKVYPKEPFQSIYNNIRYAVTKPVVIHGEMLVFEGDRMLQRAESNGIMNSVAQGEDLPPGHHIEYHVWDIVDKDVFKKKGRGTALYEERLNDLQALIYGSGPAGQKFVKVIETVKIFSLDTLRNYYRQKLAQKQEGVIAKRRTAVWEDGTSVEQIKQKKEVEVELRIIGYRPGRGKFEGMVGSILARTEDMLLEVGVSGMDDKTRKVISDDRDGWMHSIITVRVNDVQAPSEETGGLYSLYLPRFIERRTDKDTANTLQEVIDQVEAA